MEARIASLRESVSSQDYGDVVAGATAAQDDIKRAVADARIKRAQTLIEMESEWNELIKSMPPMIDVDGQEDFLAARPAAARHDRGRLEADCCGLRRRA